MNLERPSESDHRERERSGVRMADLSRATGVPVPTIKYYLREGLIPGGERTSRNQARYDDGHVRRIRLVRALAEYGGLPIATIKELLGAAADPGTSLGSLLGAAQRTVTSHRPPDGGPHVEAAEAKTATLLETHGWQECADHPAVQTLTELLAAFYELGHPELIGVLDAYAEAAKVIAAADVASLGDAADRAHAVEVVVIGTLLGDSVIAALRRIAQADTARRLFGVRTPPAADEPVRPTRRRPARRPEPR
jgi:DNA-binding transcriptional MerR regulator